MRRHLSQMRPPSWVGTEASRRGSARIDLSNGRSLRTLPRELHSGLDVREKIRIDDLGMSGAHPMRKPFVDLKRTVPNELGRKQRRVRDWDNLVIVSMHDQHRHVDLREVLAEVGFGKGLDAVVLGLDAAHHGLT